MARRPALATLLAALVLLTGAPAASAATDDPVRSHLEEVMDEEDVPGLAVAVVPLDGEARTWTLGEDGDGREVDRSTPFVLGSVAKTFTSAVVHDLVDRGTLTLEDTLGERLPDHGEAADVWALGATIYFAVEGQDAHAGQGNALATLRHIATHPPRRPQRAGPLEPILADLLARDPARRGTMAQAHRRLENIAAGGAETPRTVREMAPAPTQAPPPTRPQQRAYDQRSASGGSRRGAVVLLWAGVGALIALLVIAALAFALTRDSGSSSSPDIGAGSVSSASTAHHDDPSRDPE